MACVYTCVWGLGRVSGREVKWNRGDVPSLSHVIKSYDNMEQVQSGPFDDAVRLPALTKTATGPPAAGRRGSMHNVMSQVPGDPEGQSEDVDQAGGDL